MKRKVCIITGTRAEYGLLYWIIKGIHEDTELELQLIVTGMHLSPEFGLTVKEIESDGFPITEKVEMLLSSDTETAISTSMGIGMIGFAKAYERLKPDIVVVLGDRFEILAAVAAAVPFRIPVAHIHGGEITEGAMDELFRHAITKMSHFHFPAAEEYKNRIIQMGEQPERVFCFGSPALDNIRKLKLVDKQFLSKELNLPSSKKWGIMTFHPETLSKGTAKNTITTILTTLEKFPEIFWGITMPNADTESRTITKVLTEYVHKNPENFILYNSLGKLRYLSLMKHSVIMVGNSSSGLIEAPSFALPVVNVGDRQEGRIKAGNVIDVPKPDFKCLSAAITRALSEDFRRTIVGIRNPYGDGDASEKIVKVLKNESLGSIGGKQFHNILKK